METWVVDGKKMIILSPGAGAGVGSHDRPVVVEIQKPDAAGNQQEYDEDGELFLLLHPAVLK
jgi:hypothetical protein